MTNITYKFILQHYCHHPDRIVVWLTLKPYRFPTSLVDLKVNEMHTFSACSSFSTSLADIIPVRPPVFPILRGVKISVQCSPLKFRQSGISEASCVEGTEFTTSLVCADPPGM